MGSLDYLTAHLNVRFCGLSVSIIVFKKLSKKSKFNICVKIGKNFNEIFVSCSYILNYRELKFINEISNIKLLKKSSTFYNLKFHI